MYRYIVIGSVMEYMFHLHCLAATADEALAKWKTAFPKEHLCPDVTDVDRDRPDMRKHWRHDGHRYESGGYRYYERTIENG